MRKGLNQTFLSVLLLAVILAIAASTASARSEEVVSPPPAPSVVSGEPQAGCDALLARIDEQDRQVSQELRQIKRDLAALNQNLEKPGLREVMAGIGYILGLFGIAALVATRRRNKRLQEN